MSRSLLSPLTLLVLPALSPAQSDVARAFPGDTWAVAACAGLDAAVAAFDRAKLVGIGRDLLGEEGWKTLEGMARDRGGRNLARLSQSLQRIGLTGAQARALLAGPFAIGISRPTLSGAMLPSLTLVVEVGDSRAARDAIAALERFATEGLPRPLAKSSVDVDGARFTALALPHDAGSVLHGVHDGHWFVSNSPGFLADCVRALRGQTPSLAANRTFARSRAKLPGTRMVEVFVNAQQFGAALAPVLPYEIDALGRAFGVSGAPDLFLGFSHDGRSAHDLVDLALPGPTDGLLKAPFSRPVTNQAAQWVKRDTTLFAAFSVDGAAAVEAGKRLLAALPEQARRELGREFERDFGREVRRELGMSPQQLVELLAAFGPEVAIAVDPPQVAPPFLTVSAFIQVRDPQRAEAAVRQLLARDARQAVQFEESDGIKTWSTELRVEGARVTPTVGLREGWLVFSNFKSVAKRLLATGPLGEKALAADPRFTAAAKAHAGSALFVTGRLEPLIDAYWGLAAAGIRTGMTHLGLDTDLVPDAQVTEEGFALHVQQPLGIGALLPAVAAAFDWILRAESVAQAPHRVVRQPAQQKIY